MTYNVFGGTLQTEDRQTDRQIYDDIRECDFTFTKNGITYRLSEI